jgi:hypothetical protein
LFLVLQLIRLDSSFTTFSSIPHREAEILTYPITANKNGETSRSTFVVDAKEPFPYNLFGEKVRASSIKIQTLLLVAPPILLALTFHEYAHAYVAYEDGDDTAKQSGRLTLKPSHILTHLVSSLF